MKQGECVAAMTPTTGYKNYPPYINIKRSGEYESCVTVCLRGNEKEGEQSAYAEATFTRQEFALFLLEATRSL